MLTSLAISSLTSRKKSVLLTFLSLLISISVLLSVEHLRTQAKDSFSRTISDVDLIVGAPSGQLNLLLYSVFRMGNPTNNIRYSSFETLQKHELVKWAIPISLGDSHRGFRVLGTDKSYFTHFKYADRSALAFTHGEAFDGLFEVVIGHDVAKALGYMLGDKIVIAHGIGSTSFTQHDNAPFVITGILAPTGTPVDKTVHVSLAAIEAIHLPPRQLAQLKNKTIMVDVPNPQTITAVMLGLTSKFATFTLQRELNNAKYDRMMAILPGVALSELWQLMASVEGLLRVIGLLVLIASLFGLATMLLASMQQRQSEIAVLRVLGAKPRAVFGLVLIEALVLVLAAMVSAFLLVSSAFLILQDWIAAQYGIFLSGNLLSQNTLFVAIVTLLAAIVVSAIPAYEAYRNALHSSLSTRQ